MQDLFKRLWNDESGQSLTEYGMLVGAIVVILIAVLATFRGNIQEIFTTVNGNFDTLNNGAGGQ